MAVTGPIVDAARDEIPETWKALFDQDRGYGDSFLERRLESVMRRYLGAVMTPTEQDGLDPLAIEYLGKRLALATIGAAIDFWSKQALIIGARSEAKTYKDRAEDLVRIRAMLLADVTDMWVDVMPFFPGRKTARPSAPAVRDIEVAYTGDPNLMEPAFDQTKTPDWLSGA